MSVEHKLVEDVLEDMEDKFGKIWGKFSPEEKEATVKEAIDRARGSIREIIKNPGLMRLYFETGGEEKWGSPEWNQN